MKINLNDHIRKVADFPKKGILYYDITTLLANPKVLRSVITKAARFYKDKGITHIVAIESRGFVFAAPLALSLNVPLILARKKGKLPNKTIAKSYSLEYGKASIEIQEVDISKKMNVLLVDDLIATGGTLKAAAAILKSRGAKVKHIFSVVGLDFLNYQEALKGFQIKTLVNYHSEKTKVD